ncbi:MAG TPA: hypothetical protein VK083_09130 [Nocardia sp.]|uniref:hypothetical protein n=1 Tax=Nocardia sp. TaxID=1821 RepID=UPI002B4AC6B1|nr:hypothetical protein [Nocardia sp.]HLS76937.1 hypothetical protein [Nocardia sp.]
MEFVLAVMLPIVILAGCLVAIRFVRSKQRDGELGSVAPVADGEPTRPAHGRGEAVPAGPDVERVGADTERGGVERVDDRPLGTRDDETSGPRP